MDGARVDPRLRGMIQVNPGMDLADSFARMDQDLRYGITVVDRVSFSLAEQCYG